MNTDWAAAETWHPTVHMLQVKLLYYTTHTVIGQYYETANRMTLEFKISLLLMKRD